MNVRINDGGPGVMGIYMSQPEPHPDDSKACARPSLEPSWLLSPFLNGVEGTSRNRPGDFVIGKGEAVRGVVNSMVAKEIQARLSGTSGMNSFCRWYHIG